MTRKAKRGAERDGGRPASLDFDLRQLEVFGKVVELGSVSRAAEAVRLTQSSVSERIATLERAIGAPLFDRVGRKMVPTATGRLLSEHARRHLALKEETRQALRQHLGMVSGSLMIGGSTIPGEYILPRLIAAFRAEHPAVTVSLRIMDSAQVAADVAAGLLELGAVGALSSLKGLEHDKLWDDEMVLIAPPGHPWAGKRAIEPRQLLSEPFVLREAGSGTRAQMERQLAQALKVRQVELTVAAELGSSAAVKCAVAAGLGVSVISARAVAAEAQQGALAVVPLRGLSLPRSFYLVRDARRSLAPVAAAFRETLLADAGYAHRGGNRARQVVKRVP